jgi:hypothetical protein
MIPSRIPVFMKDAESPTIEQSLLDALYQKFNSKGWESLHLGTRHPERFEIGKKYSIIPRIGKYSKRELNLFIAEQKVIPTLSITKPKIPAIYPSDWGADENEVTYGQFEIGDEISFTGISFKNSYARLHCVGEVRVFGQKTPLPNNQVLFDYEIFPQVVKYLNYISKLIPRHVS